MTMSKRRKSMTDWAAIGGKRGNRGRPEQVNSERDPAASWVAKAVTTGILALVIVPCVIMIRPELYWDSDPQQGLVGSTTALGPGGLMWLAVMSIAATGAALWVHLRAGGRICRISMLLAGLGAVGCVYHMTQHAASLYICSGWVSAVALAMAGLHLGQHRQPGAEVPGGKLPRMRKAPGRRFSSR